MFRSLWDKLRGKQSEPEPTAGPTRRMSFDSAIPQQTPEEKEDEETAGPTGRVGFDSAIPQQTPEEKEHEQQEQSERERPDGPDYE